MSVESGYLRRKSWFVLGLVLCAFLATAAMSRRLAAQDNGGEDKPAAEKGENDQAPENGNNGESEEPEQEDSTLVWLIKCSGFIGFVILVLSVYFVSTVARLFWEFRIEVAAPPEVVVQCEGLLESRNFKGIYGMVKDDDSFFSRLLTAGITELPNGLSEARDAMERLGDAITSEMEKKISMLAVLGTLGPMIGLLGTLKGMIAAFSVIGSTSGPVKASAVAYALSEALVLTFEGVALAVPSIYFYALFRNRMMYISSSVILTSDQFLRHFSHASRSKASAAK